MSSLIQKAMLGFTAVSMLAISTPSQAATPLHFAINGVEQHANVEPYMKNGYTYVPLRSVFTALGYRIEFQGAGYPILAKKGISSRISMQVGTLSATVNGQEVKLAQPVEVVNNTTMVPVRFVAEVTGAKVKWDFVTQTVHLTTAAGEQVLNLRLNNGYVLNLDPGTVDDDSNITILNQVNEGLVRLDKEGKIEPGVANAWDISPDGLTYTFHLRDNAKWSDGSRVLAEDFEYAWKRALEPETESNYAYYMEWIKGGSAYKNGEGNRDQVMVTAKDNRTLEIILEQPKPFFLEATAFPAMFPQKKSFVEQQKDPFGSTATSTLYNGPFKVTSVTPAVTTLAKNEQYWDRQHVKLQKANLYFFPGVDSTGLDYYGQGIIDRVHVRYDNIKTFKNHPEFSQVNNESSTFLLFNTKNSALQNKKIRQALAYSLDVNQLVAALQSRLVGAIPATNTFVPPAISGWETAQPASDDIMQRPDDQDKEVKSLLQEGLKEVGLTELPPVSLKVSTNRADQKTAQLLLQAWSEKLGIEVDVQSVTSKDLNANTYSGDYDIALGAWGADYNDPMNFLDLWTSDTDEYQTYYNNPAYDELIQQAQAMPDATKRLEYLHQADEMLLNDLPVVPLYSWATNYLTKPYVKELIPRTYGPDFDLKYTYIQGK